MKDLVRLGYGQWRTVPPGPTGGRPTSEFVLADTTSADTTPANPANNGVLSAHGELEEREPGDESEREAEANRRLMEAADDCDEDGEPDV